MFGYVIINQSELTDEEVQRYRQCYCGLCNTLKKRHGNLSRLMLTYDLTFLVLLLNALYDEKENKEDSRCVVHPVKQQHWWHSKFTDYAADMTILLSYQKLLDDWNDDCNPLSLWASIPFKQHYREISNQYPRQSKVLEESMQKLSVMELQGVQDPDMASGLFGDIMAELFVYEDDRWSEVLRKLGHSLGQLIYIMDAVVDLDQDIKTGNYNPLKNSYNDNNDNYLSVLEMLLGKVVYYFDKLPIVEDSNIIKNILCSGIWTEYVRKFDLEKKGN